MSDGATATTLNTVNCEAKSPNPGGIVQRPVSCAPVRSDHQLGASSELRAWTNSPAEPRTPTSKATTTSAATDVGDASSYRCPAAKQTPLYSSHQAPVSPLAQELEQTHTMELTATSVHGAFPLNYQQLYSNSAALYGAPVMFSGALQASHASYLTGLPLSTALMPNETYLKAIQAATCGIYSPTALAAPCKTADRLAPSNAMLALAPSAPTGMPKATQCLQNEMHRKPEASSFPGNTSEASGTYLNVKVTDVSSEHCADSHFKIPNGKEGSLKHRLLRPGGSEVSEGSKKAPIMRTYSSASNFKKGTYIELSSGNLRRVEDMRTEDFIQCAERSPHHQLTESTVVKINTSATSTAIITFSYDRNKSKVDMEVSLDHPFFVYGQGWASCSPETSMKVFGLKCQRLQVGDICISLTKREAATTSVLDATTYRRRLSLTNVPNSSIKSSIHPSPHLAGSTEIPYQQLHAFSGQPTCPQQHSMPGYVEMAKLMSQYAYAKGLSQMPPELKDCALDATIVQSIQPKMINAFYQSHIYQMAQQHQEFLSRSDAAYNRQSSPPMPAYETSLDNTNGRSTEANSRAGDAQSHPLDASMSRKRRWSAPENMFDDDEAETQPSRNLYSSPVDRLSPATAQT